MSLGSMAWVKMADFSEFLHFFEGYKLSMLLCDAWNESLPIASPTLRGHHLKGQFWPFFPAGGLTIDHVSSCGMKMKSLFCTGEFPTLVTKPAALCRIGLVYNGSTGAKLNPCSSSWGEIALSERQICFSLCCKHSSFDWRQWAYLMTFILSTSFMFIWLSSSGKHPVMNTTPIPSCT